MTARTSANAKREARNHVNEAKAPPIYEGEFERRREDTLGWGQ
jgi:hypothetical protein